MPAAAEGVTNRLEVVSSEALKLKEGQDKSVKAVEAWVSKFTKKNGREPTIKDRSEGADNCLSHIDLTDKKMSFHYSIGGKKFNAAKLIFMLLIFLCVCVCVGGGCYFFIQSIYFFIRINSFMLKKHKKGTTCTTCFNSCLQFLPKQRF